MTTPKYTNKLAGTNVLIIGGTSGLGFGLAEALLEHNISNLYISSSRQEKVDSSISRLKSSYPDSKTTIEGIACNLGDESSLEPNIKTLFSQIHGELDHVVFTAGDPLAAKPVGEVTLPFMKQAGVVRFFAPFLVAKEAVSHMKPGPASSITLTTGAVSEKPIPNWSVVPLRVNLISPGGVATELWENSLGDKTKAAEAMEHMDKKAVTGRIGQVEDVVESYLYVLKDKNVTGTVIRSDSGAFLA